MYVCMYRIAHICDALRGRILHPKIPVYPFFRYVHTHICIYIYTCNGVSEYLAVGMMMLMMMMTMMMMMMMIMIDDDDDYDDC